MNPLDLTVDQLVPAFPGVRRANVAIHWPYVREALREARFPGRGFVQLTGRANYRTYGQRIYQPLEEQPDLANEPAVAAQILALFVADRAEKIETALRASDFARARRAVNGGTHGLERFTRAYKTILGVLLGDGRV